MMKNEMMVNDECDECKLRLGSRGHIATLISESSL